MKMSEGVEWALHCAVLLAALPEEAVLPGKALAEFHGISESYLAKVLVALTARGLLEAVPGPKGGYRLAKAPSEITVLAVVEAVDGPAPAFRCTEIRQRGPACLEPDAYRRPCLIHVAMAQAEQAWKAALRQRTLRQIVDELPATLDPRTLAKSQDWLVENVRLPVRQGETP